MAQYLADNLTQNPHNGEYGNLSVAYGVYTLTTGITTGDTLDLVKLPGGARVISAELIMTTAIATSSVAVGVRYADGTSTGGTTGTAVMTTTKATMAVAATPQKLQFCPFMNDVDTIVYATVVDMASTTAGNTVKIAVNYVAEGTK